MIQVTPEQAFLAVILKDNGGKLVLKSSVAATLNSPFEFDVMRLENGDIQVTLVDDQEEIMQRIARRKLVVPE